MRWVEAEANLAVDPGAPDDAPHPIPPRPEHRRVYVSLFLTLSVLAGTVLLVYGLFPKRDGEDLRRAIELQKNPGEFELNHPSASELTAWSIGLLDKKMEWPSLNGHSIVGAKRMKFFKQQAAVVRFEVLEHPVTLIAIPAWDAPGRTFRRQEDGLTAISWRHGTYVWVAVAPDAIAETLKVWLRAP